MITGLFIIKFNKKTEENICSIENNSNFALDEHETK